MLKNAILKQKDTISELNLANFVIRSKAEYAQKWLNSNLIKVIIGPRRAGKSVFCHILLKDQKFMYFNFDDEVLGSVDGFTPDELMQELHAVYGDCKKIFFDEIQNLKNWELFINRLQREGYNLILTGSNARLLSQELATALTGRHIPIEILPFNFNEYLVGKKIQLNPEYFALPQKRGELLQILHNYLLTGGFPEVVVTNLDPQGYLDVLFDSIIYKDIIKRYKVKFASQISNIASYLINNFAALYNLRKIQNILNLKSVTTIEKYVKHLEQAYLFFSILRYSAKSTLRIKSPKKVYAVDNGFVSAKAIQHSPDIGKLMENLVLVELIKRGNKPDSELFYYKTRNDKEVDFVVKKGIEVLQLIQVCYDVSAKDVEKREIRALAEAALELHVTNLSVITWNQKLVVEYKGLQINFLPLLDWLLPKEKLPTDEQLS